MFLFFPALAKSDSGGKESPPSYVRAKTQSLFRGPCRHGAVCSSSMHTRGSVGGGLQTLFDRKMNNERAARGVHVDRRPTRREGVSRVPMQTLACLPEHYITGVVEEPTHHLLCNVSFNRNNSLFLYTLSPGGEGSEFRNKGRKRGVGVNNKDHFGEWLSSRGVD